MRKSVLIVESRGWRGDGKRRRKTTSRVINVKVVFLLLCPLPLHPSLSTLPRVKQFCCCLVDYQSRPALPCKASQSRKDVLPPPRPLWNFVTRGLQGFGQNFLERPQSHRHWTGRTENETENQSSACRTNFRFAHVRVYVDPARSKPWRGPFRTPNRIRIAKSP